MKKSFLLCLTTVVILSCSSNNNKTQEEKKICYECDNYGKGVYSGVGCMTEEQWNKYAPIDMSPNNMGNMLDKSKFCRKQKLPQ